MNIDNGINLVKFGAAWCGPCKTLSKTIDKIQLEFPDVNFEDVDIDDYPDLTKDYKIRSVPTVIVFRDGEEIARLTGSQRHEAIKKKLLEASEERAA